MSASHDEVPIIVGCGFLGKHLAKQLQEHQQSPLCIVRSAQSKTALSTCGHDVYTLDLDDTNSPIDLELKQRQIYYLAPPSSIDKCDHRLDHFLSLCEKNPPSKIVYISTSGVYGDCAGAWVDENQPLAPISDRATRRVYAEKALINYCQQYHSDYVILRVGGIYGPGRLPIQRLSSLTVVCPQDAPYSNRIHVTDLANICYLTMINNISNEIFNVADGHATTMTDYYYKIADFAGLPRPPCVPMSQARNKLSASMLSFVQESRRLSTKKLHARLNINIRFPTLESGLEDCFNKQT